MNNDPNIQPQVNAPQGMPQNGPMPPQGMQPNAQPFQVGMPSSGPIPPQGLPQNGPAPQQGMPNQMGYQQQYPYPNQPMMQPPKKPMDPEKKKKLILWLSIGGGVLILGIAALIIIPILLRVDYSTAYKAAKELEPKVYDIYHSYDCGYVVKYVDSTYTDSKSYSEYIEKCKKVYDSSVNDLVSKLENADGVKRNNEISTQFANFKSKYDALQIGDAESLSAKLNIWKARHDYVYAVDDLSYSSSSDSEFTSAANYLINSGNDTLKKYGEEWLTQSLAISAAYRNYRAASWQDSSQLYKEYTNKKKELEDWVAANKPDVNTIAPLNFDNTSNKSDRSHVVL